MPRYLTQHTHACLTRQGAEALAQRMTAGGLAHAERVVRTGRREADGETADEVIEFVGQRDEEREAIERVVDDVAREPMLLDGERDLGVLSCVLGEVAPGVALHLGELADGQRSEIRFRDLRRAIDPTAQLALLLLGEL